MVSSKIKNSKLIARINEGQLTWHRYITPITEHYCRQVASRNYRGKRVAYWGHIKFNIIPMMLALKKSGAEIIVGACNIDSTDDVTAAYLVSKGITIIFAIWAES